MPREIFLGDIRDIIMRVFYYFTFLNVANIEM